ncbi:hypothetical protein CHU32_12545 [Superficieibacter electus]|uniref:Uncharacterized protein n=1 Tax=Superficieibacter electus TaxID=2022662 RepID=A0A2P5GPN4_9ENTR|nr:hypothetical protein CHU33_09615 [Superficieibacter electus]POP48527.1 hypothetical protein CHU32_12545 [Superficieibacter electus]
MIITGSPGIIWTKAKVRRVIPINVGITSPRRRRMNCNITRILCNDVLPGDRRLYCSQISSPFTGMKHCCRVTLRRPGLYAQDRASAAPPGMGRSCAPDTFNYSTDTFSKWCLPSGSTT